jgi:hypothetical protein
MRRPHATPVIVNVILLFMAIGGWPYGFYQFVHWVTSLVAVYLAYWLLFFKSNLPSPFPAWCNVCSWFCIVICALFNPIFPFFFPHLAWQFLDFFTAAIFVCVFVYLILCTATHRENEFQKDLERRHQPPARQATIAVGSKSQGTTIPISNPSSLGTMHQNKSILEIADPPAKFHPNPDCDGCYKFGHNFNNTPYQQCVFHPDCFCTQDGPCPNPQSKYAPVAPSLQLHIDDISGLGLASYPLENCFELLSNDCSKCPRHVKDFNSPDGKWCVFHPLNLCIRHKPEANFPTKEK